MKKLLIRAIELYQGTLSPDHGPRKGNYPHGFCRHYPTCSEYSKLAIAKYGAIKGVGISVFRIVQCNPLSRPKIDFRFIEEEKNNGSIR
ncbi:membrane protein insertion efficiency factor YidD [Candidatus Saccharibacteria bacterium]|nr:membrane protein insertion efficiency factor YidD [Candidatus Saccharibacteria bacterium]